MEGKVFSSMNRVNSSQSHRSVGESGPISTAMGTCYRWILGGATVAAPAGGIA